MARVFGDDRPETVDGIYNARFVAIRDFLSKNDNAMVLLDFALLDDEGEPTRNKVTYWGFPSHQSVRRCFDPARRSETLSNIDYDWETLIGRDFPVIVETVNGFQKCVGVSAQSSLIPSKAPSAEPGPQAAEPDYGDPFFTE